MTASGANDVYFVARLELTKATAWGPGEQDRARKMADAARKLGDFRLADALDAVEPATIIGDRVPKLMIHADVRVCAACVEGERVLNLTSLIRAGEIGTAHGAAVGEAVGRVPSS